jgi:hypothetical protein
MPARPSPPVYCTCERCVHDAGDSRGIRFPSTNARNAHLARVRLEQEEWDAARGNIAAEEARVFVTTVMDNGPPIDHSHDPDDLDFTSTVSLDDIVESVNRLNLNVDHQNITSQLTPTPDPPSLSPPSCPLSQRVSHRETTALQLLQNIEKRISDASETLSTPSHNILCDVELELDDLRRALSKITLRATSVQDRKGVVGKAFEALNNRVIELRTTTPDTRRGFVPFDSSKFKHPPSVFTAI